MAIRLYNTPRWQRERRLFLIENPLCVTCLSDGYLTGATVVDHKTPHKGDPLLFWDQANWQALCKQHHDSTKKIFENSGKTVGCSILGSPKDPKHHWNLERVGGKG